MKKTCLYDKNNIHIGYTKTYADGTIVYLNLHDAIYRNDGPAVIEPKGTYHHGYRFHKEKYTGRYQRWYKGCGRAYNNKDRELWFLNSINYSNVEDLPLELFNVYCIWQYRKEQSVSNAS